VRDRSHGGRLRGSAQRADVAQLVEQLHGGSQHPAHRTGDDTMNPE